MVWFRLRKLVKTIKFKGQDKTSLDWLKLSLNLSILVGHWPRLVEHLSRPYSNDARLSSIQSDFEKLEKSRSKSSTIRKNKKLGRVLSSKICPRLY